jgi:hypothetical protein
MFLIFFQLNAKADNRYDGKNFLTGCGKFEDQCPKCVCFQMQKLRFLAGKSASSPSSYIDFGSLFSQVNAVI